MAKPPSSMLYFFLANVVAKKISRIYFFRLPGTKKGDLSSRAAKPQVMVTGLEFSPTGREFAAATTEGLLMYSLDSKMIFDPFELEEEVTPKATRHLISEQEHHRALSMALRLNETDLIREVIEQIPHSQVDMLTSRLSEKLVLHVLKFIGAEMESSRHLGFYAKWSHAIMMHHGLWIKRRWKEMLPMLNQLQKALTTKLSGLSDICDRNDHTIDFLLTLSRVKKLKPSNSNITVDDEEISSEDEMDVQTADIGENDFQSKWSDDDD